MKTPKEKAIELFDSFYSILMNEISDEWVRKYAAILCSKYALNEIFSYNTKQTMHDYWCDVKTELDNLT
jgi:divalent metal cation (Fe/Co/Zn/Cd) transporter